MLSEKRRYHPELLAKAMKIIKIKRRESIIFDVQSGNRISYNNSLKKIRFIPNFWTIWNRVDWISLAQVYFGTFRFRPCRYGSGIFLCWSTITFGHRISIGLQKKRRSWQNRPVNLGIGRTGSERKEPLYAWEDWMIIAAILIPTFAFC